MEFETANVEEDKICSLLPEYYKLNVILILKYVICYVIRILWSDSTLPLSPARFKHFRAGITKFK